MQPLCYSTHIPTHLGHHMKYTIPKNHTEILVNAKAILSNEGMWRKGSMAGDMDGRAVPSCDDSAVCFCMMGAIDRAAYGSQHEIVAGTTFDERYKHGSSIEHMANDAFRILREQLPDGGDSIAAFNDSISTKHPHVMELLDKAIEQSRSLTY